MMFIQDNCKAARLCETLTHEWLKNQIILFSAPTVAKYYEFPSQFPDKRESFERNISAGGLFDERITQVEGLAKAAIEEFSPRRLIAYGPLAELPEEAKVLLGQFIHQSYLDETRMAAQATQLLKSVKDFSREFNKFRSTWNSQTHSALVEDAFKKLQGRATELRAELGKLPRGFVLPSGEVTLHDNAKPRILVIDDQYGSEREPHMRDSLCDSCNLVEINLMTTDDELSELAKDKIAGAVFCSGQIYRGEIKENSIDKVLRAVEAGWNSEGVWKWALILLDARFPSDNDNNYMFGDQCRKRLKELYPNLPVVMFTSKHEGDLSGDVDGYLTKEEADERKLTIAMLEHGNLTMQQAKQLLKINQLEIELECKAGAKRKIGFESEKMKNVFIDAYKSACETSPVLILGETGVGKEAIARYIHIVSDRHKKNFTSVNIASLQNDSLIETDLFGYEKGSHSEAKERHTGVFESADGGTVFLDEIGSIPESVQNAILRTLQERAIRRVGGVEEIKVDFRLVSATSRDIPKETAQGRYKPDLLYRINKTTITAKATIQLSQ
ncbi:MAG: sigma 54-interacting transcriptional regulator [Acidobacteria bacterium]|nr:sigma 54-interacting transcriptional regulator [Acidobacteriota bacterium]